MIRDNIKLGGRLLAWGVDKSNGEHVENWLKKPIHNTITKYMLNNLLCWNGDNTQTTNINEFNGTFIRSKNATRTGVLNYGAYGSGGGDTSTNDHELKQIESEYTETRKGGEPYNGTNSYPNTQKTAKIRISYVFGAATESVTIRELGIFHKIEPSGVYNMTARINLEQPIGIEAGDSFWFVYELSITFSDEEIISLPKINKFVRKRNCVTGNNSNSLSSYFSFPCFSSTPQSVLTGYNPYNRMKLPLFGLSHWTDSYNIYGNDVITPKYENLNDTRNNGMFNNSVMTDRDVNQLYYTTVSFELKAYTNDSFFRDVEVIINDLWASDRDIYGFIYNGEYYQFGTFTDNVFTPDAVHKGSAEQWKLTFRQRFSTDLITPAG